MGIQEAAPNRIHFYYMHDNHCFTRLYGTTLTEITNKCTAVRNESPWGMLCPPILLHDNKEIRRIQYRVHCSGRDKDNEWNRDLQKWRDELAQDPDLIRLIGQ